jgi:hypothetical protein
MTDLDETIILEALAAVQDPSQGRDIVALDMVTAIQIKGSNISFALQVPAHRGPGNGACALGCRAGSITDRGGDQCDGYGYRACGRIIRGGYG